MRRLSIPEIGIFVVGNPAAWGTGAGIDSPAKLLSPMFPWEWYSGKLHERCRRGCLFNFYKFNGFWRGLDHLIKGNIGLLITPLAHEDVTCFHAFLPSGFSPGVEPAFLQEAPRGFHNVKEAPELPAQKDENSKEKERNQEKRACFRDRMTDRRK